MFTPNDWIHIQSVPFQPSHLILALILSSVISKDNTEVLAQNPRIAEIRTKVFSLAILLAFIFAACASFLKILLYFWSGTFYPVDSHKDAIILIAPFPFLSGIIRIIFCSINPITDVNTVAFAFLVSAIAIYFVYNAYHDTFQVITFLSSFTRRSTTTRLDSFPLTSIPSAATTENTRG